MNVRPKVVITLFAAFVAAVVLVLWWNGTRGIYDRSRVINERLAPVLAQFKLTDEVLARSSREERKRGNRWYVSEYRQYDVPAGFSEGRFESALRGALDRRPFKVYAGDKTTTRAFVSSTFRVTSSGLDLFIIKLNRKKAAARPALTKRVARPKVAIVMDDFGYTAANLDAFFAIPYPITLSVLPHLAHSQEVARRAEEKGYEVILHLPLEPHKADVRLEPDTITSRMSEKEVIARLESVVASVKGIRGVSNHMGSKATEEPALMTTILGYLKKHGLYFFDSLTSEKSVCTGVAHTLDVRCARRDFFLDNTNDEAYIKEQIAGLEKFAFKTGRAIAVCHDRKLTIKALREMMPVLAADGIEFVPLSEMVG